MLIRDQDMGSLHHDWIFGHNGFLYRRGGCWWDGAAWHRPGQVVDRAYEKYDGRPVKDALTVAAADLLDRPTEPGNSRIAKIADFTAPTEPLPHWRQHLALWASSRRHGSLPFDECVIDLRAPELEPTRLVDRMGLAQIVGLALDDLPDPKYSRSRLPAPQTETDEGPRWSRPSLATGLSSTAGPTDRRRSCPARRHSAPSSRSVSSLITTT
ncbi:hypothetical protein ACFVTC_41810 [Streptomyces sp. NPDC057950]|uniref:hypothetical protein n=1 Tax=Streptomyces sp. NPDC057950 TaxID=3346288 RepID=UPI0036ED2907